jgi:hypothetical protein
MSFNNHDLEDMPDINSMLSSLIRLMSSYMCNPSTTQVLTLIHLLNVLDKHPDISSFPSVKVAVKHAQTIWNEELTKSRFRCAYLGGSSDDVNIH